MSTHKIPPLKPSNWEALTDSEDADLPTFEKLRHHIADKENGAGKKTEKRRDIDEERDSGEEE